MDQIQQAVKILEAGGIVVYPTDTAYGLAVDATNSKAVDKLYRLKGRNFKKPTHVIIPNTDWLTKIVKVNKQALILMNKFLPGPLTIVLPLVAKGKSWMKLSAGTKTMGIRYPNHPTPQALVELLKKPITTTSANVSGQGNCYSVEEVQKQFAKQKLQPDFYLDGGKLKKTKPSTVVSVLKDVTILRPGPITEAEIKKVVRGK
jgi:L-threonylcarbamoyladenylate synthase